MRTETEVDVNVASLTISGGGSEADDRRRSGASSTGIQGVLDACHTAARSGDMVGLTAEIGKLETIILSITGGKDIHTVQGSNGMLSETGSRGQTNERQGPSRYDIASSLIRLGLSTRTDEDEESIIQSRIDHCLDVCGPASSFLAALDFLRGDASTGDQMMMRKDASTGHSNDNDGSENVSSDPIVIANAVRIARRLLLSSSPCDNEAAATSATSEGHDANTLPLHALCKDFCELSLLPSDNASEISHVRSIMDDLASRSILLPVGVGSACHRAKLKLPTWAIRDRYCKRLVAVALEASLSESKSISGGEVALAAVYFGCVFDKMARHGASDSVVLGLYKFWSRQLSSQGDPNALSSFSAVVEGAVTSISSSRDCADLLRSVVRFVASKLDNNTLLLLRKRAGEEGKATVWSGATMMFLRHVCLPVLRSSDKVRDAFFRLVVLSPAPSSSAVGDGEMDVRWLVIPCIAATLFFAISDDQGDVDSEKGVLFQYFLEACETWHEAVFVSLTDESQQLYVTEFIMASIPFLEKSKIDADVRQNIILRLVQGVTNRLESSNALVRRQGMRVAELLAPLLGQKLRFSELDQNREGNVIEEQVVDHKKRSEMISEDNRLSNVEASSQIQEELKDDGDDDDSVWSEGDLVPYDLEDDEDDLAAVKRPRYLRDCLALLRTPADDKNAFESVESALKHIASLVKTNPPDLPDLARHIAKELLHAEDKFNMRDFALLRWDALCALLVHAPIAVSRLFTEALFESVSLGVRLDILGLFEQAADDLCGAAALREDRHARRELSLGPESQTKISGKRQLLQDKSEECTVTRTGASKSVGLVYSKQNIAALEDKTRRWGKGRHRPQQKTATNRFGQLAPMWFFPLISGWIRTKDDSSIWGGANGAKFFASFLIALSKILESAGNHPCAIFLASDLFELAWPFRNADSREIRMAVLVTIATCCPFLPVEFFASRNEDENLATFLRAVALRDSDSSCRQIAAIVAKSIASNVLAIASP